MSAEFKPTSHQESADEILLSHDEGEEILEENKPSEYESIDETTAGSYASTDHRNPVSVEYSYVDDVNPAPDYQAIEGSKSEANDYECIAGTNPAYDYIEVITEPRTLTSKCKKTILFLVPIFASVIVNITVGCCTSLMFLPRVDLRGDSNEAGRTVPEVLITFCVFSGLAAASCPPLMIKCGFRKVTLGGSVLLIVINVSSLTATDDILGILFGIMGGFAVGLLRTIGAVATMDHLYSCPALAVLDIIGITAIVVGLSPGWDLSHTMRAFAISAVIGFIASSFLQKNSQTQHNAPKLFKHLPFYFLILMRLVASVAIIKISPANGALFFWGVSLAIDIVGAIIALVVIKRWTPLSDESEEEDHVEETEDHVEEAEDQV